MASSSNHPRTRATACGPLLSSVDPEKILRQYRRQLRATQAQGSPVGISTQAEAQGGRSQDSEKESSGSDGLSCLESASAHSPTSYQESTTSEDEDSVAEDPLSAFYKSIGYLPPLDEATIDLLEEVLQDPSMGPTGGRINPSNFAEFEEGLELRNVSVKACHDQFLDYFRSMPLNGLSETDEQKARQTRAWDMDLSKTNNDNESIFQRTILMSLIDRHRLIYDSAEPVLDFSVEKIWTCMPMPSRAFIEPCPGQALSQTRPDMAVAFRREAIFPQVCWIDIPAAIRALVCYEGEQGVDARVFHFLTIEAKKSTIHQSDRAGFHQCLNSASQSLHNLYEFFKEAGDEHVSTFFKDVRVFSAVATRLGIIVRVHRARSVEGDLHDDDDDDDLDGILPRARRPEVMSRIVEEYPLQFLYDEVFEASGPSYTRENVVGVFEKILVGYGVGKLQPLLQNAAKAIDEKCRKYRLDHNSRRLPRTAEDYLYGLALPVGPGRRTKNWVNAQASFQENFDDSLPSPVAESRPSRAAGKRVRRA
ncbi:hypothetical protein HJFPF1_07152 [Paramyrothecium foliicola]|nr:hypothetical protein HJFPF1_07152 [Paramyrothecium foliicola]